MATKGQKHLNSFANDEHDPVAYRKRVATWVDGNSVSYEDSSFSSGDSPAVLDVATDLGRDGHKGYLQNSGPGSIRVEISFDGTNYGGQHTVKEGETLTLNDLFIKKIRLTYVSPTEYRVLVA